MLIPINPYLNPYLNPYSIPHLNPYPTLDALYSILLYSLYRYVLGLWILRGQPYIRVQYFASIDESAADDEIAYRGAADADAELPELLVTGT